MTLTKKFNIAVNQWRNHVVHGEIHIPCSAIYECEPCRRIVDLGVEALPLIRQLYDTKKDPSLEIIKSYGLPAIVGLIVGPDEFQIPEEIAGRTDKTEDYTKSWLDKNMYKYVIVDNFV